ncbi:MAG: hypothetical protein ACR652_08840 [Methylocystis sp.]|uniref:hypothetical protein n=1 Tax=Methylocystis sp. TaxID=1911079 RepID=UPI003DA52E5C
MAVIHTATMIFGRRLGSVENLQQQDSAINGLTKLTRTFAAQLEALKRYRSNGEQKVTVQRVNVSEGGQAIVGNVSSSPKRLDAKPKRTTPALIHSAQAPMPLINERQAEPVSLRNAKETDANDREPSS